MKTNRNSLITLSEFQAHVKNRKEHGGYKGASAIPVGTENQTIRKGASAWESTGILETHTNGVAITVDHPLDNATARVVMVIPTALGASKPSAVGKKDGTLLIPYIP